MIVNSVYKSYAVYEQPKSLRTMRVSRAEEKRDYVALSTQAKDFQSIRNVLSKVPDIRADKVRDVTKKLETEGYELSSSSIADKIISSLFNN